MHFYLPVSCLLLGAFLDFKVLGRGSLLWVCTLSLVLEMRKRVWEFSIWRISSLWWYFCVNVRFQVSLLVAKSNDNSDFERRLDFGKTFPMYQRPLRSPACIWIDLRTTFQETRQRYLQAHPCHKPCYKIRRIFDCRFCETEVIRYN